MERSRGFFFFFNDTATTEIYTLSLHDALPILSYGELDGASDGFAAWLAARGVVKGDRVALIMPNCPQVIIAQLGVWKAGAVAVPLNPLSSEEELAHALAGTGDRAAVPLSRFYHKI